MKDDPVATFFLGVFLASALWLLGLWLVPAGHPTYEGTMDVPTLDGGSITVPVEFHVTISYDGKPHIPSARIEEADSGD